MEFLKILLPLLFLHNVPRAATTMCTTIERAHEKCCEDRKPISCLVTRSKDPVCDCHPRDQENRKISTECVWNTFHQGPYLDCNMCGNMKSEASHPDNPERLWHAQIKDQLRQMVPQRRPIAPFTAYLHQVFESFQRAFAFDFSCPGKRYPIREIDRSDDAPHCAMSALNHQNFYDNVVLTCWLYDCEPRLRIPKATIQMNVMDKTKNLLCYPQILHSGSKLEFCKLYTTIRNVTVDKRDGTDNDTPENRGNHTECVLPPICDANGKIDSKEYMYPLINKKGKWKFHTSYCENLCPENENYGKNHTCRIIPSCDPHYDYNYFKVPKCLPWCSDDDSYTRDPAKRSRICNVRPICNQEGKADEPYSATNPYGARENECMKMGECRGDWTEDTHFCTGVGPSAKKEDGLLAHAGTILLVLIIVVSLIVFVLLTVCIGGGIAAYCFLWKNKKTEETEGEEEEEKCEGKKTAEAVGPKALPNSKTPKPGVGGSKEKKGGKATADVSTYFVVANNNVKKGQGSKVPETLTLDRPRPTVEMALRKTPSTKDFVVMFPAAWNEEQIAQDIERMKEEERQEENYRKTQDYWRKQREKEENEQPKGKQTPPPKKGFLAKIFEPSPAGQAKKEEEKKKKEEEKEKEEIRKIYDHSMLKD